MPKKKRVRSKVKKPKMISVFAQCSCGCCTEEMKFESMESAQLAFDAEGMQSNTTIIDDEGIRHENIDTFYGFSLTEDDQENKGLGYLASLLS